MIMQVTTVQVARGRVTAASLQITFSMLSISTTGMPAHAQLYLKIAPLCGVGILAPTYLLYGSFGAPKPHSTTLTAPRSV